MKIFSLWNWILSASILIVFGGFIWFNIWIFLVSTIDIFWKILVLFMYSIFILTFGYTIFGGFKE